MNLRCILHIGTAKTGSTTIQSFLQQNRQDLLARGFYFPHSLGQANHEKLVAYALDPSKIESKRRHFSIASKEDVSRFRGQTEAELFDELHNCPGTIETLVLSNEHCHSRLTQATEIQALEQLLRPFCSEIRVLVYLRRQDRVALSLYNTRVLSGSSSARIFPSVRPKLPIRFDHCTGLDLYASIFGQENITVRVFPPKPRSPQHLLMDFANTIGLKNCSNLTFPDRLNQSLAASELQFIRMFNLAMEREPLKNAATLRKRLIQNLRETHDSMTDEDPFRRLQHVFQLALSQTGHNSIRKWLNAMEQIQGQRPLNPRNLTTRREATDFYACFRRGNQEVLDRYKPHDGSLLFDDCFREYT